MGFLDNLGANLTNAGRTMSQSAKNFSDTNALKRDINAEKRNIQQKYAEIGQMYFEKFSGDPGCDFFSEVEAISESMRRIEELEAQIEEVQNRRPELVPIPDSSDTARSSNPQVRPSAMVCMQCGQTYETTQIFCSNCGQKLTPQYPTAAAASLAPEQTASDVRSSLSPVISETTISPEEPETPPVSPDAPAAPAPQDAPAPEESPKPRFCLNCGAKAPSDSVFCAQCGTKLV